MRPRAVPPPLPPPPGGILRRGGRGGGNRQVGVGHTDTPQNTGGVERDGAWEGTGHPKTQRERPWHAGAEGGQWDPPRNTTGHPKPQPGGFSHPNSSHPQVRFALSPAVPDEEEENEDGAVPGPPPLPLATPTLHSSRGVPGGAPPEPFDASRAAAALLGSSFAARNALGGAAAAGQFGEGGVSHGPTPLFWFNPNPAFF